MADRTPPRRRQPRVENFAVRRNRNVSEYNRNNNFVVRSFNEINQMGAPAQLPQLPEWWLAKVNQGSIQIPVDKRQNQTNLTDIDDGEVVVRIRQNGFDFFYRLENWVHWMMSSLSRFPNKPVPHPTTRVPVKPEDIDIFTANIQAGGRRKTRRRRRRQF